VLFFSIFDIFAQSHHGFWWEVFSVGSAGLAAVLLGIAIYAYKRHKLVRLVPLSAAFGLFILRVGLLHLDSLYPMLASDLQVASVATDFGMLSMLFLAVIRK
jgi:hypothetical protein